MSTPLRRIAERFIDAFRDGGGLDNLPGAGKPLPQRTTNPHEDVASEIGHKVMRENGALPPEVVWRAELAKARAAFKDAVTDEDKRAAMLRIADLELRTNLAAEARLRRR